MFTVLLWGEFITILECQKDALYYVDEMGFFFFFVDFFVVL